MERAGIGTDMQDLLEGEDQELRVLDGLEGYDGLEHGTADEGFAKETAAADNGQDGFVTPAVFVRTRAPRQASIAFLFSWLMPENKGRSLGRTTEKSDMRRPP